MSREGFSISRFFEKLRVVKLYWVLWCFFEFIYFRVEGFFCLVRIGVLCYFLEVRFSERRFVCLECRVRVVKSFCLGF